MTNEKFRRQIAFEAARLMYQRQESEYFRAKLRAAKRICRGEHDDTAALNARTPLFSEGIIDSFALVTLLSFVEESCGFRVRPDEVTLENYRFIFTGELPPAYQQSGANRTMISDAARQAPRSLWNSAQIALAALIFNLILGTPAAFIYARYGFPGKKVSFLFLILSPLVPAVANRLPSSFGSSSPRRRRWSSRAFSGLSRANGLRPIRPLSTSQRVNWPTAWR